MNFQMLAVGRGMGWFASLMAAVFLLGCATPASVNWDSRIGTYSWEDAVAEFGPPDRVADQTGGVKVAEWIWPRTKGVALPSPPPSYDRAEIIEPMARYGSSAPNKVLRLSFTPDGKLIDWKRNY